MQYEKGKVAVWLTGRWRPEHRLALDYDSTGGLEAVRVAGDGSTIAAEKGGVLRGWSTTSGTELREVDTAALIPPPSGAAQPTQLYRLQHEAEVRSETVSPNGACLLTSSAYRMASGGAPTNGNVVRLWDASSATLLHQWHFDEGLGPDSAFFAGQDRIVALFEGDAYVYRTALCEPLGVLRDLVMTRVGRTLTETERSTYLVR